MRRSDGGAAANLPIIGLDVGSSKIAVFAVERADDGGVTFLGAASGPTHGMRDGMVVNIAEVGQSVVETIQRVEEWLGQRVGAVCVGVGGQHLSGANTKGSSAVTPVGREITQDDIDRAILAAQTSLSLPENREILHEIPRAYTIDGQEGVRDPLGLAGFQLAVEVHYTLGASTAIQNLLKCVAQAGLTPEMLVANPLAAGEGTLAAYDEAQAVAVLDVGAQTSNLAVYTEGGAIWGTQTLAFGGDDFTRELARRLQLPMNLAEGIKRRYGHVVPGSIPEFELIETQAQDGGTMFLPREELAQILARPAQQLVDALTPTMREAQQAGIHPSALALVGGGARLAGLDELLMSSFEVPASVAQPAGVRGLPEAFETPEYVVAAGLALWAARMSPADGRHGARRFSLPALTTGVRRIFGALLP